MGKIIVQGRLFFGIAIIAYGVENFFCGHLGLTVRGVPWFSTNPLVAYPTGVVTHIVCVGLPICDCRAPILDELSTSTRQ